MRYIFSSARLETRIEFESSRGLSRFDSIFHRTEQRSCRLDSINVRVRFEFRNFEQNTLLDSIDLESNSSCSNQLDSRSQLCLEACKKPILAMFEHMRHHIGSPREWP